MSKLLTSLTTLAAAGVILILASCSQQQVSDDTVEVEVLPQVEMQPVEEIEETQPVILPDLPEAPVEPVLEPLPEPPAKPDTVILTIGRHVLAINEFPFKAEFEGGIGHVICFPESGDSSWLVCR